MVKKLKSYKTTNIHEAINYLSSILQENKNIRIVALYGELGAGKTYFVREYLRKLGYGDVFVSSPTWTIANTYPGNILHIDCYRIDNVNQLWWDGLLEEIEKSKIAFIEWAERIDKIINKHPHVKLFIRILEEGIPYGSREYELIEEI